MSKKHRFVLQPYIRGSQCRFRCPECQHRNKTLTRYIDLQTGNHLADHVGKCDRADKCGYHFTPRQYFGDNTYTLPTRQIQNPGKQGFYQMPASLVTESTIQKAFIHNNFILFLVKIFGWAKVLRAAERYQIGTSKHWPGATVFWQIDMQGRVRSGKIMLYDKATGKRVKEPFNHVTWAHSLVGIGQLPVSSLTTANCAPQTANFNLKQCFFGEHLLNQNTTATVAIAESEKTAVMASMMMPQFIWLAAGSLHGLDTDKCQALQNRTVLLFPDVGAYGYWKERAGTLKLKMPTTTFTLHDEMERTATPQEREHGADMADRWISEFAAGSYHTANCLLKTE